MTESTTETVAETRRSLPVSTSWTAGMVWAGSLLLPGLAWIAIVQQSQGMPGRLSILGTMRMGTMGMPLGPFLVFWTLMMVAMMGPSVAPIVSLHLVAARTRTHGPLLAARVGAFVISYLLVWSAVGFPIFGLAVLEGHLAGGSADAAPPVAIAAGALILVAAGLYQVTPLQARCLASCNRHLGAHSAQAHLPHAPLAHPPLPEVLQDVSAGLAHGKDCLGACGGCMLALVAVGLMSLPWMVAITLIVAVEKVWRYGDRVAMVVGLGLMLLGIFMAADPQLIFG